MKDKRKITIEIANLPKMSLFIPVDEEETNRKAEKKINELYKTWSEKYNDKKPIEIMGMVAFRFAQLYQSLAEEVGETDLMLEDFENNLNELLMAMQGIKKSNE
ncbi:MAG: cell division protein ZapA [Muribaculaceae bacterium]|nr:cell division protein ZapA [Muribaculaceae bacterium]